MATITIRSLDEETKARLRIRAAQFGHSMEEEVRNIIKTAVIEDSTTRPNLAKSIRLRMDPLGGVDLELLPREPMRAPPDFSR